MIEITVRTLDSQNHKFSVDEEFTVLQFKQHIASTVNIAAETQRIIYSGRVLLDDSKLSTLDVNGKVVHLVERPPPSDNDSNNDQPNSRISNRLSQQNQQRVLGGNAMYLGSMAFPIDAQNLVPPPPTSRLAANRLAIVKRMLRRAETTIAWLENPSNPPSNRTLNDDVQVDVFETRVIVPATTGDADNENLINAVQSSLLNPADRTTESISMEQVTDTSNTSQESNVDPEGIASAGSSPEAGPTPLSTSVEDLSGSTPPQEGSASNTQETISTMTEMATLLDTLNRLHTRFGPFLDRYRNFLRDDPVVDSRDEARTMDRTFHRVSEVLHYFSHAYHSLSDMTLRVRSAPPRRLVCRPILIQQTALVSTGIPIQVEAQINFTSNVPASGSSTSATQTAGENVPPTTTSATTTTTQNITRNGTPTVNAPNRRMSVPHFEFMNIPGMLPTAVRVQSIPIGIRAMRSNSAPRTGNTAGPVRNQDAQTGTTPNADATPESGGNINNPNVEFFMEVTPESITIDSLETSLLEGGATDGAQANNVPQPTPELIQSIMQMAGQLVNRGASTSNVANFVVNPRFATTSAPTSTPASTATTDASSTNAGPGGTPGQTRTPGQNSQARGNTQTNPTTATHTRSTSRPHVHFSQHAVQGFDPFLPCTSHHINHLRRSGSRTTTNNNQNQANNNNVRPQNGNMVDNQMNPMFNLVQGLLSSMQNVYGRRTNPSSGTTGTAPTPTSAPTSSTANLNMSHASPLRSFASLFPNSVFHGMSGLMMPGMGPNDPNARGPTLAQILNQAGEQNRPTGIFNELITLLSETFTVSDFLQLNNERLDPILRIRGEIRQFVSQRVLEGNAPSPPNIERAINKFLTEIQPFLTGISNLPVRDDIDILRSVQLLLRTRLPTIINLAVSHRPNAMKLLIEQIKLVCRHMCALFVYASINGHRGVEDMMNRMLSNYMEGMSPELQQWIEMEVRVQLRQMLLSIEVPPSALQQYIIKNVNSVIATNEPMEVDTEVAATEEEAVSNVLGVIELNDGEDAPPVVLGSESWHGQVPSDWVPLIARDTQRQRRQSQVPLSDAYLSGMPSKRRKVVTNNKPQGTLSQVISDSIRSAVTTTGNTQAADLDAVASQAGADLNIQSAYRDLLRTSVQARIQGNEDFTPERFPNATSYFSKSQ